LLEHYIHSFLSFTLNLIILVYCLKPNEYNEKIEDIKFSIEHGKDIPEDDRLKYLMTNISEKKSNDDITEITNNLFYNSTRSIFTVLFWFLVLGPAGCLGYIILDYFIYGNDIRVDQKSKNKLKIIFGLIEYIPARLSAFSFAIVGNFENSLNAWKNLKNNVDLHKGNIILVNTIGLSSFEIIGNNKKDDLLERISYIQTIISRSLLAWLSFTMLLIIGGFFI
jgi:membrane protein required for beta-lactamase induction